jgi:hypothetical protein
MSISLTAVTGTSQTGLTSPTYTPTADTAPDTNGKQYAITTLGGTQTGVLAHSVASPFTVAFWRPRVARMVGRLNVAGWLANNPVNQYKVITRKGVIPLAGQAAEVMIVETIIRVPAGAEVADNLSVRAALSCHFGALSQQSSGIGDVVRDCIL